MIVVDTNVISYLLIPNPLQSKAEAAARKDQWCAPVLWRSEFRNVLASSFRRKQITFALGGQLMGMAERLLWGREFIVRSKTIFDCLAVSNRSAYDCEFVALALDLGLSLLTTDLPLIQEFPKRTIHLLDYV